MSTPPRRGAYDEQETPEFIEGGLARLWGPPKTPDGVGVDLLFVDSPFLESVVARAPPVEIAGTSLPVASVEDLLLIKIDADRPHDLDDAIKDAFADQLDCDYVRRWAAALGIKARIDALNVLPQVSFPRINSRRLQVSLHKSHCR